MLDAAWTLRVENYTKGWSLETYAGEPAPADFAPGDVVLTDPFKGTWGWSDYPNGWQPRTADFELRAATARDVQQLGVDPGDLFDVHLFREFNGLHGLTVNTWHRCVGYLDEPEASATGRGVAVKLGVSDPLALLAEVPVDSAGVAWPQESLGARLARIAAAAGINIASRSAFSALATMGPVTPSNKGALAMLQECLAGVLYNGAQLVLRGSVGGIEVPELFEQIDWDVLYVGNDPMYVLDETTGTSSSAGNKPVFWIATVGHISHMSAPYVLTAAHDLGAPGAPAGVGLYVATRTPIGDLWEVAGGAALSAGDVLRDGTTWVKSRASAINQVKLVGVNAAGDEASVVAQYTDLVASDGPSTRTVQTQRLIDAGAPAVAAALLPDRSTAVPDWTADAFTFTTRDLTPDELDAYSSRLYPDTDTAAAPPAGMQVPVAIVGVDETAALTGNDLSGVMQGATVQVTRGVLSILGQLRNELLRPSGTKTNLVSYADLRTEVVYNVPAISWSAFGYHSDDAVPYTGSDKTFDADQAHASFGHVQLTYRDLRLIGVDA